MKILIAYDGSDCAKTAVADLIHAGLPDEAEVLVVSAAEALMPLNMEYRDSEIPAMTFAYEKVGEMAEYAQETGNAHAKEAVDSLASIFQKWHISSEIKIASPASAILAAAREFNPDLVVVGSHGRGAMGRLFMGSVSMKVLSEAHCSVRVARAVSATATNPMHIVVGFDGSHDSEHAIETLLERKYPPETNIHIVAGLDLTLLGSLGYVNFAADQVMVNAQSDEKNWLEVKLESMAELLRKRYAIVTTSMDVGSPKDVLLEEAEQYRAECIIVGARGLSHVERMLLGSVSHAIAARAKCSVEVVRRPA